MWIYGLFSVLTLTNSVTSEQETERVNRFVKGSHPEQFDFDTTLETRLLSQYVTSFLDTCAVTSPFAVRGLGECQGRCVLNPDCVALTYTTSDRMCTHCVQSRVSGQGLKLPHSKVMISTEAFERYGNIFYYSR